MIYFLLFATGLFAGTVDAIAGGGGLISLPVLLGLGMHPHVAFGTNKLQASIGTFMATQRFYRHGLIEPKALIQGVIFGIIGSSLGAIAWQVLHVDILRKIIPVLLILIFIYTLISPRLGDLDSKPRMRESSVYIIFGFLLGFYDGFFGPGTGSFWVFVLTFFLGFNLIKATAYTKVFNLNSNIVATLCFMIGGNVNYTFALCMAVGQIIGGRLGAHLAITKGAKLIRPIFLCVVFVTIASLTYKSYASSTLFTHVNHEYGMLAHVLFVISMMTLLGFLYMFTQRYLLKKSISTGNAN